MNASVYILAIFGFPVLLACSAMWRGFVLSILWAWFIVPLFGAPPLSIPYAIGLALVVGFLTDHASKSGKDIDWADAVLRAALGPAVVLGVGLVVTKFL